jgi:hypothetical protein
MVNDMATRPDYSNAAGQKRLMAESMGLPPDTYARRVDTTKPGDYGADPIGDGKFRMIPSGDVVDYVERCRRLGG